MEAQPIHQPKQHSLESTVIEFNNATIKKSTFGFKHASLAHCYCNHVPDVDCDMFITYKHLDCNFFATVQCVIGITINWLIFWLFDKIAIPEEQKSVSHICSWVIASSVGWFECPCNAPKCTMHVTLNLLSNSSIGR